MSSSCAVLPSARTDFVNPGRQRLLVPSRVHGRRGKCHLGRRSFAFRGIVVSGVAMAGSSLLTEPVKGADRLPFKPEGYNYWTWRGHKIHYVVQGEGFPVVLIHGFGASAYHWRVDQEHYAPVEKGHITTYMVLLRSFLQLSQVSVNPLRNLSECLAPSKRHNIPELAKSYKVYALDLLGFGWSEKALVEYDTMIWKDQVVDFLKEIVSEPAVLVGNSLGGFTALVSAGGLPEQVAGVVLLNSAGQFGDPSAKVKNSEESVLQKVVVKPLKEIFQRIFLGFLFWQAKQPARIESVLKSVYVDSSNVDDYLIESITMPAADPNAGEVYYRLMSRFMMNQSRYTLDSILTKLSCPLLLIWGDLDPWVGPTKAIRIQQFYPNTSLVNLQAGHCPHDEVPELVNKALLDWLPTVAPKTSLLEL